MAKPTRTSLWTRKWPPKQDLHKNPAGIAPELKCPVLPPVDDKVIDSRRGPQPGIYHSPAARRMPQCGRRFTTYERIDEIPYMGPIKKDARPRTFRTSKDSARFAKACEKLPVPTPKLEAIATNRKAWGPRSHPSRETHPTTEIGRKMIMHRLKKLDKFGYVAFASVSHGTSKDVQEFMSEA